MDVGTFEQLCWSGRNQELLEFRDGPDSLRAMEFVEQASSSMAQFMALAVLQHGLMTRPSAIPEALDRLFKLMSQPQAMKTPPTSVVFSKLLQVCEYPSSPY